MNLDSLVKVGNFDNIQEDYINYWKFFQYIFDTVLSPVRNIWLYWYVLVYILHKKKAIDKYFFYIVSMHYAFNALGDFINSTFSFYDLTFGFSSVIPENEMEVKTLKIKLHYVYYLVTVPAVIFWYISKIVADSYYYLKLLKFCKSRIITIIQTVIYLILVFTRILIPSYYIGSYDRCSYEKKLGFLSSKVHDNVNCTKDKFWNDWWKWQILTEGLYIVFHSINFVALFRNKARLIQDLMIMRSDAIHNGSTSYNYTEYIDDVDHPFIYYFIFDSQFRIYLGSLFSLLSLPFFSLFTYSYFSGHQKTMECLRILFVNLTISIIYVDQILQSKFDPNDSSSYSYHIGYSSSNNNNSYSNKSNNQFNMKIETTFMSNNNTTNNNNLKYSVQKPRPLSISTVKDNYDDFINIYSTQNSINGSGNDINDTSFSSCYKKRSPVSNIVMEPKLMENYDDSILTSPRFTDPIFNNNHSNIFNSLELKEPLSMISPIDRERESSKYLLNLTSKKNKDIGSENSYSSSPHNENIVMPDINQGLSSKVVYASSSP